MIPTIDAILTDLKQSAGSLRKRPAVTCVILITLALGIGASSAIFTVVNAVLLRPLPYDDPSRLVWVADLSPGFRADMANGADYILWRDEGRTLETLAAFDVGQRVTLQVAEEPQRLVAARVSSTFLPTLGVPVEQGTGLPETADRVGGPRVVLISHSISQRVGSDAAVGRTLLIDEQVYHVQGVLPREFVFPGHTDVQILMPLGLDEPREQARQQMSIVRIVGRLRAGMTVAHARDELQAIRDRVLATGLPKRLATDRFEPSPTVSEEARTGAPVSVPVVPPREGELMVAGSLSGVRVPTARGMETYVRVRSLQAHLSGDVRPSLLLLAAAVGCVLLIACANVANLLLARATDRHREMAIRTAVGARRSRLIQQMLTENILIGLLGGVAGLCLTAVLVPLLLDLVPTDSWGRVFDDFPVSIDRRLALFTGVLSIIASLLFGVVPTVVASGAPLSDVLKSGGLAMSSMRGRRRLRSVLVVSEVAIAVVLLLGAGLLLRSFTRLLAVDVGFSADHVLTLAVDLGSRAGEDPQVQRQSFREMAERVGALSGIQSVAYGDTLPLRDFTLMAIRARVEQRVTRPEQDAEIALSVVSPDYFQTIGMRVLRGRSFSNADQQDTESVAIVNQALSRQWWGAADALGRRVQIGGVKAPWTTIVGIVADVRHDGLARPPRPIVYQPFDQRPTPFGFLAVRANIGPEYVTGGIRTVLRGVNPSLALYDVATMNQRLTSSMSDRRFVMILMASLAAVAVTLAIIGLYGVLNGLVAERTREIGIRIALGAAPADIRWVVVRHAVGLVLVGAALGVASAYSMTPALGVWLFGISPVDPLTFSAVPALLLVTALVSTWMPVRRASGVDPVVALRHE